MHCGVNFREIGIYNLADYLQAHGLESINLYLSNSNLPQIVTSNIKFINQEIIVAQQIQNTTYTQ